MYYYYQDTVKPQKQFIAEEEADIAKLPTTAEEGDKTAAIGDAWRNDITYGSTVICVETGDAYVLTSDDDWTKVGGES